MTSLTTETESQGARLLQQLEKHKESALARLHAEEVAVLRRQVELLGGAEKVQEDWCDLGDLEKMAAIYFLPSVLPLQLGTLLLGFCDEDLIGSRGDDSKRIGKESEESPEQKTPPVPELEEACAVIKGPEANIKAEDEPQSNVVALSLESSTMMEQVQEQEEQKSAACWI